MRAGSALSKAASFNALASSSPDNIVAYGSRVACAATSSVYGREVFVHDPSLPLPNGVLLADLDSGASSGNPLYIVNNADSLYMQGHTTANGYEMFVIAPSGVTHDNMFEYRPGTYVFTLWLSVL